MNYKEYFENLLNALLIEKEEELKSYQIFTLSASIKERVEAGVTFYPLEFLSIQYNDFGDFLIEVKLNPNQEGSAFSAGKIISLFNADGESSKGQMISIKNDLALLKIEDEDAGEWVRKGKIGIDALVDTKTYELFENTLKGIINDKGSPLINAFYESSDASRIEFFEDKSLNESQNQAVANILCDSPITIIHGPPGTGKTTTLVSAIKELVHKGKRVLLCSTSNAAVDNICHLLMKEKLKVVRLGNAAKIDDSVAASYLENKIKNDRSFKLLTQLKNQAENLRSQAFKFKRNFGSDEYKERKQLKFELKEIRADIRKIQQDISKNIIEESDIICGTFYGVQKIARTADKFDYVIIDEAGQAIEPAVWSVANFGKKMVLAGDDLQLPPTVKSYQAAEMGLAKSLLERATEINFYKSLLNVQYRMNDTIMGFSNDHFYKGALLTHESVKSHSIANNIYQSVEFIDIAGCGFEEQKDKEGGGITNPGECGILGEVMKEYNLSDHSFGVITPYRAQLNLIEQTYPKLSRHANTVDSFQGQEKDIIFISLVRSNLNSEIGFLKDYRRMNVAMTRARKKLVIIGDSATIGQDKFFGAFLDYVEKKGSFRSAWEFN